jgi:hypothetical protein
VKPYILFSLIFLVKNLSLFGQSKDLDFWKQKYDSAFVVHKNFTLNLSKSKTSDNLYHLAYGLDGAAAMFEATGDEHYLEFAFLLIDNVLENAVPTCDFDTQNFPCGYNGWPALANKDQQFALYESFLFRYITRFLVVLHKNPILLQNEKYRTKYNQILAFTETHIWEKWQSRGLQNMYRSRTFITAHWANIALNLKIVGSGKSAECSLFLDNFHFAGFPYTQTGNLEGSALRKQKPHHLINRRYFSWMNESWDGQANSTQIVQDVSHANGLVSYMVNSYQHSTYFNYDDLTGLKELLFNVVWLDTPASTAPQDCFNFVKPCNNLSEGIGKFQTDGWVKLGRIFPDVQAFYENPKTLSIVTEYLPHISFNAFAHLALNAKILSERGQIQYLNNTEMKID